MNRPTTIFLNGTSSAGKTSIAKALQATMNDPYLYFSADIRKPMLPPYREGLRVVRERDRLADTLS